MMKIQVSLRYTALALAMTLATTGDALELPTTSINGKQYYYYEVKRGDTIYSLVSKLGISRKDLIDMNPSAADMLRTGEVLYFPVEKFGALQPSVTAPDEKEEKITPAENTDEATAIIEHKVQKGETLYGISRKFDVNVDEIVSLNPGTRLGVKTGSVLKIPVRQPELVMQQTPDETPGRPQPLTPVESPSAITAAGTTDEENGETGVGDSPLVDELRSDRVPVVALLMPFMLDSEEMGKQTQHYMDFYKGLLLAADSLSDRGGKAMIYVADTNGDNNRFREILHNDTVRDATVIIAPEPSDQLAEVLTVVSENTWVVNVFNVKDNSYLTEAKVIQSNMPHTVMYDKAISAISKLYPDYIPVIMINEKGKTDKSEFVGRLKEFSLSNGVEPKEIIYDGVLESDRLEALPADGKYLLIPISGSLTEFNKFAHAVKTVQDAAQDESKPQFALFGYPDWTAFRGDSENMLHELGATVYSRFYYDGDSFDTRSLNSSFRRHYGEDMIEVVPSQGVLGFDIGNWLLRNIFANGGTFNPGNAAYRGVQSSYDLSRSDDGGYYNDEIYILRFMPGESVERLPLK